jgi:hypothetical protein
METKKETAEKTETKAKATTKKDAQAPKTAPTLVERKAAAEARREEARARAEARRSETRANAQQRQIEHIDRQIAALEERKKRLSELDEFGNPIRSTF